LEDDKLLASGNTKNSSSFLKSVKNELLSRNKSPFRSKKSASYRNSIDSAAINSTNSSNVITSLREKYSGNSSANQLSKQLSHESATLIKQPQSRVSTALATSTLRKASSSRIRMTQLSEKYFVVKDAAIILPRVTSDRQNGSSRLINTNGNHTTSLSSLAGVHEDKAVSNYNSLNNSSSSATSTTNTGEILVHLQAMIALLRPNDTLILAVKLFSYVPDRIRYLVIVETKPTSPSAQVSTENEETLPDYEESVILGLDLVPINSKTSSKTETKQPKCETSPKEPVEFNLSPDEYDENDEAMNDDEDEDEFECKVGLVLPIYANSEITLDGDGGFKFVSHHTTHIFKPVSIQAMWSAYQCLHKAFENARKLNFYSQISLDNLLALYAGNAGSSPESETGETSALNQTHSNSQVMLRQQHHEWVKYYSSLIVKYKTEQHYINEWFQKEERSMQRDDFTTPYFDCLKLCKEQEVNIFIPDSKISL
jgi:hypothetical protein